MGGCGVDRGRWGREFLVFEWKSLKVAAVHRSVNSSQAKHSRKFLSYECIGDPLSSSVVDHPSASLNMPSATPSAARSIKRCRKQSLNGRPTGQLKSSCQSAFSSDTELVVSRRMSVMPHLGVRKVDTL
jgi:hypothetical protein